MAYLMLAGGIVILVVCGDMLVRGAVALAVELGIPSLVIGLTIVAFGTSAPELVVSLRAALAGSPGIAIGNVVGSNIANVLVVLGIPALICSTDCNQPLIRRNMLYVLAVSVLFIVLCHYGPLSFWHGAILFAFMIAFLVESGRRAARSSCDDDFITQETVEIIDGVSGLPAKHWLTGLFLLGGLIGLPLGAHLTVTGATAIAAAYGIPDSVVGLTIVAVGTSLPELATTTAAALRGHAGIALGNVLGSNLFNILAIMGLTSMVAPLPVPDVFLRVDLWVMLAAALAITPIIMTRGRINWPSGVAFLASYLLYLYVVYAPQISDAATIQSAHH